MMKLVGSYLVLLPGGALSTLQLGWKEGRRNPDMNGHASHSLSMAQLVYMADQLELCVLSLQYMRRKLSTLCLQEYHIASSRVRCNHTTCYLMPVPVAV